MKDTETQTFINSRNVYFRQEALTLFKIFRSSLKVCNTCLVSRPNAQQQILMTA